MAEPETPEQLADALRDAASRQRSISLGGHFSKNLMGGPMAPADVTITTRKLSRVLQYEPHDLTISVEAGLPYCELTRMLAANRQMVPLDPPFADEATVGGVIATNGSGPRRRLYGTARDLVIGMRFATLEGKLVQSGGMVVKNVAGLDMAKLMIGSFGTLAAIAVVNFKVQPRPAVERSFLLSFDTAAAAIGARNTILKSALQPAAVDLLNPEAAAHLGNRAWTIAVQAGGNAAVVERYERELGSLGDGVALEGSQEVSLWRYIQNYPSRFLGQNGAGAVARVSCTLKEVEAAIASVPGPAIARAASGIVYGYFPRAEDAAEWAARSAGRGWKAVVEFSPESRKESFELWPDPGSDFETMQRIKRMLDPDNLLNRGRLYRRI